MGCSSKPAVDAATTQVSCDSKWQSRFACMPSGAPRRPPGTEATAAAGGPLAAPMRICRPQSGHGGWRQGVRWERGGRRPRSGPSAPYGAPPPPARAPPRQLRRWGARGGFLPRAPARRSSAAPVRARGAASPPVSSSGCTAVATAGLAAWRVRRPPRGAAGGVASACAGGAARAVTAWGATRGGGWRAAARPAAPRRRRGGWLPAGPREGGRRGRARVGVGADPDGRRGPHRPVAAVVSAGGRPTSCGTRPRAAAGRRVRWASVAALRRWLPRPPALRAAGRAPPTSDAATTPPFKGAAPAAGGGPWGGSAAATRSRGGAGLLDTAAAVDSFFGEGVRGIARSLGVGDGPEVRAAALARRRVAQ